VTPIMSILHSLAAEDNERLVWFVHGARDGSHHPLTQEVRELAANRSNISTQVAYSRPRLEDKLGRTTTARAGLEVRC
jgi:ferredoxin-NADP reductase